MENNIIIVAVISLILFYVKFLFRIYRGLNKLDYPEHTVPDEFISIIIPFRNESANILSSFRSMENQDYDRKKFEVIYVNDNSDDESLEKLRKAEPSFCLRIIDADPLIENSMAPKKQALLKGINNSRGEIIITTDADCVHTPGWITALVSSFNKNTAMAAGPVQIIEADNVFNKVQALEFKGLMAAAAGLIGSDKPVICSGANLAYRKNIFFEAGGFSSDMQLSSGDDELLMQRISRQKKHKIKFCAAPGALVKTNGAASLKEFFNQRRRWASKGLFYPDKLLTVELIFIFLYYLSFLPLAVLSFFSIKYMLLFILSVFTKLGIEYIVMKKGNKKLFNSDKLNYFILTEIFQVMYIIIAAISGAMGNFKWKERAFQR